MPTYEDFVRLARVYWRQAHAASTWQAARELYCMAREYQQKAAKLDGGKLPKLSDDKSEEL
jgi:hypothetical protein